MAGINEEVEKEIMKECLEALKDFNKFIDALGKENKQ